MFIEEMGKFRSLLEEQLARIDVNLHTSVLSNGTVSSRKLIDFLEGPNAGLSISIDGYREVHDTYRRFARSGKGSWVVIEETLKALKGEGIKPLIMVTISQKTAPSLPRLVRWIHENSLRARLSIVRQPECSWKSGNQECQQEYDSRSSDLSSAFDAVLTELEDSSIHIDICK